MNSLAYLPGQINKKYSSIAISIIRVSGYRGRYGWIPCTSFESSPNIFPDDLQSYNILSTVLVY